MASPRRIDIHHHFVPDFYRQALEAAGGDPSGWHIPTWSVEQDQAFSASQGIATTILSMTAPGPSIEKTAPAAAALARKTNEYAASIVRDHPSEYGFFAALPSLLDTKYALEEICHALDTLNADGVTLFTRYGLGNHYLGHPDFKAIWDALDERKAVVFVHPTHAVDTNLVNPKLPQPVIDYPQETCRTAVDLIVSGTLRAHPNVKVILPHAGGTLPYLSPRAAGLLAHTPQLGVSTTYEEFLEDARRFWYDTALSSNEYTLALLKSLVGEHKILYGSDYPYAPTGAIEMFTRDLDNVVGVADRSQRENALELFPRLKEIV